MIKRTWNKIAASLWLVVLSGQAFAHTAVGSVSGFAAGFEHPWHGADHLLTMLAVGLWATALGGRALWLLPLAFVGVMAVGAGLHWLGITLPHAEWLVSVSVVVLGVALWRNWRTASGWAGILVGSLALFHGYVHAAEIGMGTGAAAYAAGFLAATASLHGLGIAVGLAGGNFRRVCRAFGVFCTGVGLYLLAGG